MSSKFLMIIDGACPACSSLGQEVANLIEINPVAENSEEAKALREKIFFQAPCLIEELDGQLRVFHGWHMRLKLMRILGFSAS